MLSEIRLSDLPTYREGWQAGVKAGREEGREEARQEGSKQWQSDLSQLLLVLLQEKFGTITDAVQ